MRIAVLCLLIELLPRFFLIYPRSYPNSPLFSLAKLLLIPSLEHIDSPSESQHGEVANHQEVMYLLS